jgi:hypothetical protein
MRNETLCLQQMMERHKRPASVLVITCGKGNSKSHFTSSLSALAAKLSNSESSQISEESFLKKLLISFSKVIGQKSDKK